MDIPKKSKYPECLSKLKPGISPVDFKIYYDNLQKEYNRLVEFYYKKKGKEYALATHLAHSDLYSDMLAVKNGEIELFDSKVPGFRRY